MNLQINFIVEYCYSLYEKFIISAYKFFNAIGGYGSQDFRDGVIVSLSAVLIFIIVLKIIFYLLFHKSIKKCSGLSVKSDKGSLYVSKDAIVDLVASKQSELQGLYVKKTYLMKRGRKYFIRVLAELRDDDGKFPEMLSSLQSKILSSMNDNLGITAIQKVEIVLKRVKRSRNRTV